MRSQCESSLDCQALAQFLQKHNKFLAIPSVHERVLSEDDVTVMLTMHYAPHTWDPLIEQIGPLWKSENGKQGERCWQFNLSEEHRSDKEMFKIMDMPADSKSIFPHLVASNLLWWTEDSNSHGLELKKKLGGAKGKEWIHLMELQSKVHIFFYSLFKNLKQAGRVFLGDAAYQFFKAGGKVRSAAVRNCFIFLTPLIFV